jgi:hypothetical protein
MQARLTIHTRRGRRLDVDAPSLLTADRRELVHEETYRWIKQLRLVRYGSRTMRERFEYRGDSLWWFTEIYLHKTRRLETAVAATLAFEAARDELVPSRIEVESTDPVVAAVATAFARARGVPVDVGPAAPPHDSDWPSYLIGLSARLARLRPAAPVRRPRSPRVAAFVHTAFWRKADGDRDDPLQESYVGPVLHAIATRVGQDDLFLVGVGPRRNFRARRWWDPLKPAESTPRVTPIERLAPRAAIEESLALWRSRHELALAITAGESVRAAGIFRGLDLWSVLEPELRAAALLQWPWSARAMDEAAAALAALAPRTVVTYAEAGGWGRALMLEARRHRVPSVGLQHGFIYRHWLNYRHEPDEIAPLGSDPGFPLPDRTLVYDRLAAEHLRSAGHFPDDRVAVTGNARLDDLTARIGRLGPGDRAAIRQRVGAGESTRILLLAAKCSEIAGELRPLAEAVAGLPGTRLVVKPHPAETPDVYHPLRATAANVFVTQPGEDLGGLLAVADGLVTMNSTVAVDGLVLGVPALVIGLPNNLSPFVEAGVMLGASGPAEIRGGLDALLYDRTVGERLRRTARDFLSRYEIRSDGRAAERATSEILTLTG